LDAALSARDEAIEGNLRLAAQPGPKTHRIQARRQPLAARMRPADLDEVVGHEQLIGERGALRRAVERGHLGSILLWGPPGSGKTSLARVLADAVGAVVTISAVMSGVAEVRALVAEARERLASTAGQTSCSSTRSTASTRPSRTRCCPTSRTARSRSSAPRPRTPTSRSTRRSCRGCGSIASSR
jgi:predicted ATPase with chaperone activity